ncbi:MAG: phage tail protein [Acidobacteria bacterium]|nr:phage tail protein [Acidobacteriota bacterium]
MSIYTIKEQATPDTPILLFECRLANGAVEQWATHRVRVGGKDFEALVLGHNLFEVGGGEDGAEGFSRIALTLANADSHFSQIERNGGIKGARLTVSFVFYDLKADVATTAPTVLFRGTANPPEECSEARFRVSFTSRLNLSRMLLPAVRIQRRCPWMFPRTATERQEAVSGLDRGAYSPFFRCGYSPDQTGGSGTMVGNTPFTACDYTRTQCEERGMFRQDNQGRVTRRFGGQEFVPASTLVRGHGESGRHVSIPEENQGRYNDFVPMVYGTAFYQPPVVFASNDGNLTRMEVLLGMGEIAAVLKVVVNGFEIPAGQAGANMTGTGWFNLVSNGNRTGEFNADYSTGSGQPLGDPYGSMAYLSVVVPNRINDGRSLPKVEVLLQGLRVSTFNGAGNYAGEAFSSNPAWVLLDVLRRCGWDHDELDLVSFAQAAAYCDEPLVSTDLNGNIQNIKRYECNLVLRRRRSAADVVRGIRASSALYLTYGAEGKLHLRVEAGLAQQQPLAPLGTNATGPLGSGWPAYEFGDGSYGLSGILRRDNGDPAIHLYSRSTADSPNRISVEFQDAFNDYQQDSVSLIDPDDVIRAGQEVAATLSAEGIPNINQALRIARLQLNRSTNGNTYVQFETSMRGLGLRPGDLITLTYLKEGLDRQLFRVQRIAPGLNFARATITAQIHDEAWYSATASTTLGRRRRRAASTGVPRPLVGNVIDGGGRSQFGITESANAGTDGSATVALTVGFAPPAAVLSGRASIPIISFTTQVDSTGGQLAGPRSLYYAVAGVDADGRESDLSFVVHASIPASASAASVTLKGLSFDPQTASFHVYRGPNPQQLQRIATGVPPATQFVDPGLATQVTPAPDESYDHANFYWRLELVPETAVTVATPTTAGNAALALLTNEFRGAVVRITEGRGADQERVVIANDATTFAVNLPWTIVPDATSRMTVAEAAWRFGATTRSDRAVFEVPNRQHATVEITGRSANVRDEESEPALAPLTRWLIGGSAGNGLDLEVAPEPFFGLSTMGTGGVDVLSVGFADLANTRSATAATLTLHYWDEMASPSLFALSTGLTAGATQVPLNRAAIAVPGALIQVDGEVMQVEEVLSNAYRVTRAVSQTTAVPHSSSSAVYHLKRHVVVIPFARDFFGSPASGSFSYSIFLPNVRIAAADMVVTNSRGDSPVSRRGFTFNVEQGLRTLSGGQLALQVDGYLAVQSSAVTPVVVSEGRAVRDIFAVVAEAPMGQPAVARLRRNGQILCDLTIPAGAKISNVVDGFGLPPLTEMTQLGLDIIAVPPASDGAPGRDLTVTIRL